MSKEDGFLTERDIKFLQNQGEYYTGKNARQQRYETREVIAGRARQAFRDFTLLYETLDEHERDRVFDVGEGDADFGAMLELRNALAGTIAFLYRSLEGELDSSAVHTRSFGYPFSTILEQGISQAEADRQPREAWTGMVTVEFTVEMNNPREININHAIDRLAEYDEHELSETEVRALLRHFNPRGSDPDLDFGELADRVKERRDELGGDADLPPEKVVDMRRESSPDTLDDK